LNELLRFLSTFSDLLGIFSVIVSVWTWIWVRKIKSVTEAQIKGFKSEQKRLVERITSYRLAVYDGDDLHGLLKDGLRECLYRIRYSYSHVFSFEWKIADISNEINKSSSESFNRELVEDRLDYIIARLSRREGQK